MHKLNQTSYKKGHIPWSKKHDVCSMSGCGAIHEARGYCIKHYKRFRKTGSAFTPTPRDPRPPAFVNGEALIPLGAAGKDGTARVVQSDWWVSNYKWHKTKSGYAAARIDGRLIMMHRLILSQPTEGEVDHINRDKLDNRRQNLRVVSRSINAINTGLRNTNTSGYKGVSYSKAARKYEARITRAGIQKYLGLYSTPEDAHKAYIKEAKQI